jgi:hypothetical protein
VTTVWVSTTATSYACLCEPCLDAARESGVLFADALAGARVQGELARDAETAVVRCAAGHAIVLRRSTRPAALQHDDRQLSLT